MKHCKLMSSAVVIALSMLATAGSPFAFSADLETDSKVGAFRQAGSSLILIEERPAESITLYTDRSKVSMPSHTRWSYMCGSDTSNATIGDLQKMAEITRGEIAGLKPKSNIVISAAGNASSSGGLNIVFEMPCTSNFPPGAAAALESAATYIESQLGNPIEVRILVVFSALDLGIIGGTGSVFFNLNYDEVRAGLILSKDSNDFIQDFLPNSTTIPVRYSTSSFITNEATIFLTRANLSAGIGRIDGRAALMQFSNTFSFDFDPSDGIGAGQIDFQSVVVHEVGHALGFTTGVVTGAAGSMDTMDLFRFERFDGLGDYNPDTLAEFMATPRNVVVGTEAILDVFAPGIFNGEYRMEDAMPQQASHFLDNASIGIMDPTFSTGESFYPNFYRLPDLEVLDAMGWDYPIVTTPSGLPVGACCTGNGCVDGVSGPGCVDNLSLFVNCFSGPGSLTPPATCSANDFAAGDLDDDGDVDLNDISIFQSEFGQSRGLNGTFLQGSTCSSGFCAGLTATNSCDVTSASGGCNNMECTQSVCGFDPFCCTGSWDSFCIEQYVNVQCSLNDDCDNAAIALDGITSYRTVFATTDGEPDCPGDCFVGTNDVWFDYQATCSGQLTVSTCNSNFDTTIQIYQGTTCPPFIQRVCADDDVNCAKCDISFTDCTVGVVGTCGPGQGACTTLGVPSSATTSVTIGTKYLIRVGGWGGDFGSGQMEITCN